MPNFGPTYNAISDFQTFRVPQRKMDAKNESIGNANPVQIKGKLEAIAELKGAGILCSPFPIVLAGRTH